MKPQRCLSTLVTTSSSNLCIESHVQSAVQTDEMFGVQAQPLVTVPFLLASLDALLQQLLASDSGAGPKPPPPHAPDNAPAPLSARGDAAGTDAAAPKSRVSTKHAVLAALHLLLDLTPSCLRRLVDAPAREATQQARPPWPVRRSGAYCLGTGALLPTPLGLRYIVRCAQGGMRGRRSNPRFPKVCE